MKEVIAKVLDALLGIFKNNYKRPRLWISLGAIVVVFILIFPYIDSNFFYYSRMEKRIQILEKLMSLDEETINNNLAYKEEYDSILQEVVQQRERSVSSIINRVIDCVNNIVVAGNVQGNRIIKLKLRT